MELINIAHMKYIKIPYTMIDTITHNNAYNRNDDGLAGPVEVDVGLRDSLQPWGAVSNAVLASTFTRLHKE